MREAENVSRFLDRKLLTLRQCTGKTELPILNVFTLDVFCQSGIMLDGARACGGPPRTAVPPLAKSETQVLSIPKRKCVHSVGFLQVVSCAGRFFVPKSHSHAVPPCLREKYSDVIRL